ncbi:hypothetical protein Nepgr_002901 [Nepenthes gracilis]|uniref:Translation initiation factor eIF2B subunit delta n=1 Tax=Nepenthes gracilis TaxID=150966 RepID=A0AAD3P7Y4_NEPGR|nr:hypothetical protein Nepgr_002901 [Nepenthes gracilis]
MESRRPPRTVSNPIVRQVGFIPHQPPDPNPPDPAAAAANPSFQAFSTSPPATSLSPVMIPPPFPGTSAPLRCPPAPAAIAVDTVTVGSYGQSESTLATSPATANRIGDPEFCEDSHGWLNSDSGTYGAVLSIPSFGFDMSGVNSTEESSPKAVVEVEEITLKEATTEVALDVKRDLANEEMQTDMQSSFKPLKEKTGKAESVLQVAQRAVKPAAKALVKKSAVGKVPADDKTGKVVKQSSQKKDVLPTTSSEVVSGKKGIDRSFERDKKKDVPPPRMQYDDKNRVEKAKKRSVMKQTEARNRVELFLHLPQYEHGNLLSGLESKFFHLDAMHPSVYKVGLQYLAGDITGDDNRCVAMLQAFKEAIKDYSTPPEKILSRDLTARISSYVSFLIECRPLSFSMGNAIRFLKRCIAKLPLSITESAAKDTLCSDIDRFVNEKIIIAGKVIVGHAASKVRDSDVLLTYGSSSIVEMILLYSHKLGKQFRVVVVDSHPKLEGQALLRRLVANGLSCTYTHINAISYIMHEVTRVFLGADSVLANGTVYSRIGTACVAMVAHAFQVPVLVCCEAYKFHERIQLDSICSNELGDPEAISKVSGRRDINYLDNSTNKENLQLLHLLYDITPSEYVSVIVTDYGMVPPTSVPVIVREYGKEQLFL